MTATRPAGREAAPLRVAPMDAAAFAAAREEWNGLLARSASDTVFLTWEWLVSWWEAYGGGRALRLLAAREDGRLVGVAPLQERTVRSVGPLRARALATLGDGSGDSDYLDWISERGREPDLVAAACAHLDADRSSWDLLLVNEIPAGSPHVPLLDAEARRRRWSVETTRVPCGHVPLPATWEEYLRSLKPRMRTKVRSVTRDLLETHGARFLLAERPEDLAERLPSLYDLHNRRWEADGGKGIFVAPEKRSFYESMSRRFLERGWLRFYSLRVGDRYVAHQYCFEYGPTMFLLQEGLDPGWFAAGAGNALRGLVFRDCVERGLARYDFLAGMTPHKRSWGAVEHESLRLTIGRPSAANAIRVGVARGLDAARGVKRRLSGGGGAS